MKIKTKFTKKKHMPVIIDGKTYLHAYDWVDKYKKTPFYWIEKLRKDKYKDRTMMVSGGRYVIDEDFD